MATCSKWALTSLTKKWMNEDKFDKKLNDLIKK